MTPPEPRTPNGKPAGWRIHLLCASAVVPYLFLTLPRLDRPGVFFDEALTVMPLFGGGVPLRLGRFFLPLGKNSHNGALESYLAAPFVLFLGTTARTLHLASVMFGAAALGFVFFACRNYFKDNRVAWMAAFLLGTLSPFVSSTYFGFLHSSAMVMFQAAAVWSLTRWRITGRPRDLGLIFFCAGAALACRSWSGIATLTFLATAAALAALFGRPWEIKRRLDLCRRFGVQCAAAFFIGAFPLTLQVLSGGRQFTAAVGGRILQGNGAAGSMDYSERVLWRLRQVRELGGGDPFLRGVFSSGDDSPRPVRAAAIAASMAWAILACLAGARGFSLEQRLFCPLFVLLCIPIAATMPGASVDLAYDHVLSALPLLMVSVAVFIVEASDLIARKLGRSIGVGIFLATGLLLRLEDIPKLQSRLADMRGLNPYFSMGTAQAARWLAALPRGQIVFIEWEIAAPATFLLGNRTPHMIGLLGEDSLSQLESTRGKKLYYLGYSPEMNRSLVPSDLRLRVECLGSSVKLVRSFQDLDQTRLAAYEISAATRLRPGDFVPRASSDSAASCPPR